MTRRKATEAKRAAARVEQAEGAAAKALAPYGETRAVKILSQLSELGDQPQMRTLCAATIAAGLAGGFPKLTRAGIRMLAAHSVATGAKNVVKHRIDRTRPKAAVQGKGSHKIKRGEHRSKEETSFPSGHSAGAAAVAQAFAREYPEHRGAAYAAAGAIALAQIPRCAHYPTDVGVGLAIGILSEVGVEQARRAGAKIAGLDDRSRKRSR